jgi:hypothetical protein
MEFISSALGLVWLRNGFCFDVYENGADRKRNGNQDSRDEKFIPFDLSYLEDLPRDKASFQRSPRRTRNAPVVFPPAIAANQPNT